MSKIQNRIYVIVHERHLVIKNSAPQEKENLNLHIDRNTNKIEELSNYDTFDRPPISTLQASMILGIFKGFNTRYLVVCTQSTQVAQILQMAIFKIDTIAFVPINSWEDSKQKDVDTAIQNIQRFVQTGYMYFSSGMDLSLSQQRSFQNKPPNERFIWNSYMLKEFRESNISGIWTKEVIQVTVKHKNYKGFVSQYSTVIQYQKVQVTLISRRSHLQGGTRFHSRGIDDEGNVANFVESEQITVIGEFLFSYVSIRGSVPIFWNQEGVTNNVKLTRSFELTNTAFVKHFFHVCDNYGRILGVNLMSSSKPDEQVLTDSYEKHIQVFNNPNNIRYEYFDFSAICKRGTYEKLNPQIMNYDALLDQFSYFAFNFKTQLVSSHQLGTFRINCLDCLNRTNAFMTRLFFLVVAKQLRLLGIDFLKLTQVKNDILCMLDEPNKKLQHDFIACFKNLWADNGDQLSQIYAGTTTINADVTRQGQRSSFMGLLENGMKSITRIYNQNFDDEYKQVAMNLMLHGMLDHAQSESLLDLHLKSQQANYYIYDTINLLVISWNVNGKLPQKNLQKTLFNLEDRSTPDIVVIGLQEMVSLNPQNVMIMSNENSIFMWNQLITSNLKQYGDYINIAQADLVGLYTTVYVRKQQIYRIQSIEFDSVKTGLGGALGNKGANGIKFKIDETLLMFVNTHLSSGAKYAETRLLEIKDIHDRLLSKKTKSKEVDYRFFFGDMNFRIEGHYSQIVQMTESYKILIQNGRAKEADQILKQLLELDQLLKLKSSHETLRLYQEGLITFLPTYKYDSGTDIYDTSKKMRIPSWCDRILFQNLQGGEIQQHFYQRQDCSESDHKPVTSYFQFQVNKIDQKKKEEIRQKFFDKNNYQNSQS